MQKNSIYCFRGIETANGIQWSLSGILGQSLPPSVIADLVNLTKQQAHETVSYIDIGFEDIAETNH